jgi:hypothetical protein
MTLLDIISALNTKEVTVTVKDSATDKDIITFISEGIAGVESDLSARPVISWSIIGASKITVKVGEGT